MKFPFTGSATITQSFGANPPSYAQFGMKGHNGIDFGLRSGTPVRAATNGVVRVLSDPSGFGVYVEITGEKYRTIYAHLNHAVVPTGQFVSAGDLIAYSDNSGNSTGPHLHFGVKPLVGLDNNNGYFGAIDPEPLLEGGPMAGTFTSPVNGDTRDAQGWYNAYAERNEQWRHDEEVVIPDLKRQLEAAKAAGGKPITDYTIAEVLDALSKKV